MANFEIRLPTTGGAAWPDAIPELWRLPVPALLLVPLASGPHDGVHGIKPAGTRLRAGEPLTDSTPEAGHVPVAPVAGTLGAVRQVVPVGGRTVRAVELHTDPDAADEAPSELSTAGTRVGVSPFPDGAGNGADASGDASRQQLPRLIDALCRAGVHARRQTSPDLIEQLIQVLRRPIDTVLCNLLDNDPPLRLQAQCGALAAEPIVEAVSALRAWTGAMAGSIVVDADTPGRWLAALRSAVRGGRRGPAVRLIGLENDYPQSDPSLLIHRLSERRLRPGRLPVEQGVLMLDGPTAVAVARVLRDGAPMTHVPVAIFDHFVRNERRVEQVRYVEVPVGTRVIDALGALGIDRQRMVLRAGALLRDIAVEETEVFAGGEAVVHLLPRESLPVVYPCIRCGWCVQGCPTRIHPAGLLEAAQHDDQALADHYGLEACIECGICSYVCPSNLPLLAGIRQLRSRRKGPAPADQPTAG